MELLSERNCESFSKNRKQSTVACYSEQSLLLDSIRKSSVFLMPECNSKTYDSSLLICQDVSGGKFLNARHWFPQTKSHKLPLFGVLSGCSHSAIVIIIYLSH